MDKLQLGDGLALTGDTKEDLGIKFNKRDVNFTKSNGDIVDIISLPLVVNNINKDYERLVDTNYKHVRKFRRFMLSIIGVSLVAYILFLQFLLNM